MMTNTLKWLRDVTQFANAGNLGEFLRIVDKEASLQAEKGRAASVESGSGAGLPEFLGANGNAFPDNVAHLR